MKKRWILLLLAGVLLLCGCSQPVYETIADEPSVAASATSRQIVVNLPEGAATPTAQEDGSGMLYECDGFSVTVQTLPSGDLDKTLYQLTGYHRDQLPLIESVKEDCDRYDTVFTSAGEGQLQIGRVCILDDGSFHYAVTVMAPEGASDQVRTQWEQLYATFRLVDGNAELNTGS